MRDNFLTQGDDYFMRTPSDRLKTNYRQMKRAMRNFFTQVNDYIGELHATTLKQL